LSKTPKFSPEVQERAVRMVLESRGDHPSLWAATQSIAGKMGFVLHSLYDWGRRHEIDHGLRDGVSTAEAQRIKGLERMVRELRRADEILNLASAFFAQAEQRLTETGIDPSVGSRGDSYDNALAETINGLYKAERNHRRGPWKTRKAMEIVTLNWASWANYNRLMQGLGYIPPAEAEANYYRQLTGQPASKG
jgi:transposase InsO family protein